MSLRKKKKQLIAAALAALLAVGVATPVMVTSAPVVQAGGWSPTYTYTDESGTRFAVEKIQNSNKGFIYAIDIGENANELVIPESIDGVAIKGFDTSHVDSGFVFSGFERVTRITVPKNMGGLPEGWYDSESGINGENIESWIYIAENHGMDLSNLEEIVVDAANPYYTTEGGVLFNKDKTDLLYYPAAKPDTSYQIHNGVQNIYQSAFQNCTGLTSVTIPGSVRDIGWNAFQGCTGLTSVTIADGVEYIGGSAFEGCTSLTSVTIPDSVFSIYDSAFRGCTNLEDITLPDTVYNIWDDVFLDTAYYNDPSNWEDGCLYIDNWLIKADSEQLTGEYVIKEGTVGTAYKAFENCTGLTSITIPDSVQLIGEWTFQGCTGLTSIMIPDSVRYIMLGTFQDCTNLEDITLSNSAEMIGYIAFENTAYYNNPANWKNGCLYIDNWLIKADSSQVTGEYVIKAGTVGIADNAFQGCTDLTSVTIPDSVGVTGNYTFEGCTALASVAMPEDIGYIGASVFSGCTSLQNLVIPNGAKYIAYELFADCTSLQSVTIPQSVAYIYDDAFRNCDNLTDIYYNGTKAQWEQIQGTIWIPSTATIHYQGGDDTDHPGDTPDQPGDDTNRPSGGGSIPFPSTPDTPSEPEEPSKPTDPDTPAEPGNPSSSVRLDTSEVTVANGGVYSFLVKGNNDTANLQITVSDPDVAEVILEDGSDTRGAKYRVEAKGPGTAEIQVTYNGETTTMTVHVGSAGTAAPRGSIMLDTANYIMAPGNMYDIGLTIKDTSGNTISGEQVQELIASGKLSVRDSRTGSVADLVQLPNGNFRVTGKNEGTCYIIYEIGGNRASVRIDVQNGVQQHGTAIRHTSAFTQDVF